MNGPSVSLFECYKGIHYQLVGLFDVFSEEENSMCVCVVGLAPAR